MTPRFALFLSLSTALLGSFATLQARAEADPYAVCAQNVARAEKTEGVPQGLLTAISTVESGRWDKDRRATLAWPWTVTSGGNGQFFATKAEAIAEVRRMKGQGIRNIDVGCMQINLHHHAEAFDSLDEAFDPATNAAYAARFLRSLHDTHQDWMTAASHYHSATPELGARYRLKVLAAWNGQDETLSTAWTQTANWTLAQPASAPARATPPAAQEQPLHRQANSKPGLKVKPPPSLPAPVPSETVRAEARSFAQAWRDARLAEYKSRKAARGGV
ncbi:MAG: lytic transglycosylase domain-containing protein [Alphaproteobacteria bacterium]|nr:lytic transglycosylase domain-containing protein [Alphaproteobacteria bacterium]